jgi:hypothetical protein
MRGFPKHINTAQDFKNLLKMPEYKKQAKAELKILKELKDDKIKKATTQIDPNDSESEWNMIEVVNPDPKWKRMKFKNKKEVADLLAAVEVIPNDKQKTY